MAQGKGSPGKGVILSPGKGVILDSTIVRSDYAMLPSTSRANRLPKHPYRNKVLRRPVAPTFFRNEPFGENVEGLFAWFVGSFCTAAEFNLCRTGPGLFSLLCRNFFRFHQFRGSNDLEMYASLAKMPIT